MKLNQQWVQAIRTEAASLEAGEDVHNAVLHEQIKATWKDSSPKMWASLERESLADPLARVLQARMWARQQDLLKAGLPVTDAREQAEREHLMLEPEDEAERTLPMDEGALAL